MKMIFKIVSLFILCFIFMSSTVKIMPTGDSLTGMNNPGYRGYLYKMLKDSGFVVDFVGGHSSMPTAPLNSDGDNSGYGGFVIGPDSSALDREQGGKGTASITWQLENGEKIMSKGADVMILMIGVNDFWNNKNTAYKPSTVGAIRLDTLVEKIFRIQPNLKLIVSNLTPAKWNLTGADYKKFNDGVPAIVQNQKDKGRSCFFVNNCKGDFVTTDYADDIHFKASGFEKLAKNFYAVLAPVLKSMANTAIDKVETPKVILYPNPTMNDITIKHTSGNVEIVNLIGETVHFVRNYNGEIINVNNLSSGIYFAKTADGAIRFVKH